MGSSSIVEAVKPTTDGRQPWGNYFMNLAECVATRSTCSRLKVGCVFVEDNRILTTGYNGALPGRKHCDEVGCLLHENHCVRGPHAEQNAVAQAAQHGVSLKDSTLYVNFLPCIRCYVLVLAAGCKAVYYKEKYGTTPMDIYYQLQGMSRLEQVK
jgi:dCMP deaminase